MFAPSIVMRTAKAVGVSALYFRVRANDVCWALDYPLLQAIYEVEFYEAATVTGVNTALAATKFASESYPSNLPPIAGDASSATYWQNGLPGVAGSWWACQFASPNKVRSVVIKPNALYYAKSYALEASNDGTAWTPVKTVTTSGVSGATQTFLNIQ